jgi:hypothetical protein
LPSGTSHLRNAIAIEDRIRSFGVRISDAADDFKFWLGQQDPSVAKLAGGTDLIPY